MENAQPVPRVAKNTLLVPMFAFPVWTGIYLILTPKHVVLALLLARHAKLLHQPAYPVSIFTFITALAIPVSNLTVNWTRQLLSPYSVISLAPAVLLKVLSSIVMSYVRMFSLQFLVEPRSRSKIV